MLNQPGPVQLFERAAARAARVLAGVRPDQLADPTPCTQWSVQQLVEHMVGSTDYLLGATGSAPSARSAPANIEDYRSGVAQVLEALGRPGALDRWCASPLGFEWSVAEATAGTFMDNLIHTWDLAVATGQDRRLDDELVQPCVEMFLPEMPERGRAAGMVGPAMAVPPEAAAQDRLLGAMGRRP
jgi:uncharacterized protein (TIGR03086 family)